MTTGPTRARSSRHGFGSAASTHRQLIDIDSTTGREATWRSIWLCCCDLGYRVTEQPIDGDRFNVSRRRASRRSYFHAPIACRRFRAARPAACYAAEARATLRILAAQIAASGDCAALATRVGVLFVAGEERGSDGAKAANTLATGSRYLVNGEPTDNRLATATRGVYRVRLTATGRAAHSSLPELGESAIDKLIDALVAARGIEWPVDLDLGRTYYSIGLIKGGVAPNVIPPAADAEMMFRTVGSPDQLRRLLEARVVARGAGRYSCRPADAAHHASRVRHGGVLVHDGHSVPRSLGRAAPDRPGLRESGAYRRGARGDRRTVPRGRSVREDRQAIVSGLDPG